MAINPVHKGKRGENELCVWLHDNLCLSYMPEREYNQAAGKSGSDILEVAPFCIEVKRRESLDLDNWWWQCVVAAKNVGGEPVVAFRQNKKSWEFLIPARHVGSKLGFVRLKENVFIEFAKISIAEYVGTA